MYSLNKSSNPSSHTINETSKRERKRRYYKKRIDENRSNMGALKGNPNNLKRKKRLSHISVIVF